MKPSSYKPLGAEWTVEERSGDCISPSKDAGANQILLLGPPTADGAISAAVTPIEGQFDDKSGHDFRECSFIVRYSPPDRYYIAGIAGYGKKYFIARRADWQWLKVSDEPASAVRVGHTYRLRLEFVGDRLTLYDDNVEVLSVRDPMFASGRCGLRVNRTKARFEHLDLKQATESRNAIFVGYSHADEKWLHVVTAHLEPLRRNRKIELWADTKIEAGLKWRDEIRSAIARAKVAVLLVSPDFFRSKFIQEEELPELLRAATDEGLRIFWIPVTTCLLEMTDIAPYQAALPRALDLMEKPRRNKELTKVAGEIWKAFTEGE